jgi:hypothetical protein
MQKTVHFEKGYSDYLHKLLSMTGNEIAEEYGLTTDDNIWEKIEFDDGFVCYLVVEINDGVAKPYCQFLLVDDQGWCEELTEPCREFEGRWNLGKDFNDVEHILIIK